MDDLAKIESWDGNSRLTFDPNRMTLRALRSCARRMAGAEAGGPFLTHVVQRKSATWMTGLWRVP